MMHKLAFILLVVGGITLFHSIVIIALTYHKWLWVGHRMDIIGTTMLVGALMVVAGCVIADREDKKVQE